MPEKNRVDPDKTREIQERNRERSLIVHEMKNRGASTVDELAKAVDMGKTKVFRHLIAMRQFRKILIVGERDNQLVYALSEENSKL